MEDLYEEIIYDKKKEKIIYNCTYVSSNGTENASYCIGVLKSTEGPLSGYKDQENNPITIKEDGFLPGPGHGCFVTTPKNNVLMLFYTTENMDLGVSEFRVFGENYTLAKEKGM